MEGMVHTVITTLYHDSFTENEHYSFRFFHSSQFLISV